MPTVVARASEAAHAAGPADRPSASTEADVCYRLRPMHVLPTLLLALAGHGAADPILLTDGLAPARAALAAGRADEALRLLAGMDAPGLQGRALELLGRRQEACALYAADAANAASRKDAAILRHARCARAAGDAAVAKAAYASSSSSELFGDEPLVLVEAAHALLALGDGPLAASLVAKRAESVADASLDVERREALAQALLVVVAHGAPDARDRALARLYASLAETAARRRRASTRRSPRPRPRARRSRRRRAAPSSSARR
jgi:hypothetical protein